MHCKNCFSYYPLMCNLLEQHYWIIKKEESGNSNLNCITLSGFNVTWVFHNYTIFLQCLKLLKWLLFQVKVQNDVSDEMFSSKWHYAKNIIQRQKASGTTTGYRNYDFRETEDRTRVSGSDSKTQKTLGSNSVKCSSFGVAPCSCRRFWF